MQTGLAVNRRALSLVDADAGVGVRALAGALVVAAAVVAKNALIDTSQGASSSG
jgi:hypothetical protein